MRKDLQYYQSPLGGNIKQQFIWPRQYKDCSSWPHFQNAVTLYFESVLVTFSRIPIRQKPQINIWSSWGRGSINVGTSSNSAEIVTEKLKWKWTECQNVSTATAHELHSNTTSHYINWWWPCAMLFDLYIVTFCQMWEPGSDTADSYLCEPSSVASWCQMTSSWSRAVTSCTLETGWTEML